MKSPKQVKNWSGTPKHSYEALQRAVANVHLIDTPRLDRMVALGNRVTMKVGWDLMREPLVQGLYRTIVGRQLRRDKIDVIVAVGGHHKLMGLSQSYPLIWATDGFFGTITRTYSGFRRLSKRSLRLGEHTQREIITHCDVMCLASNWTLEEARSDYDLEGKTARVLPFGSNFDRDPGFDRPAREQANRYNLLFVGGDWIRKGGPLVLEAFKRLKNVEPTAELHIVGCSPKDAIGVDGVTVHGFLDKSDPAAHRTLTDLYRNAGFLFVLSLYEAFGVVFIEANSYGLPSVTADVGGIRDSVTHDENGILLAPDADAQYVADEIRRVASDPDRYMEMADNARHRFETRPGWSSWAAEIGKHIKELTSHDTPVHRNSAGEATPTSTDTPKLEQSTPLA